MKLFLKNVPLYLALYNSYRHLSLKLHPRFGLDSNITLPQAYASNSMDLNIVHPNLCKSMTLILSSKQLTFDVLKSVAPTTGRRGGRLWKTILTFCILFFLVSSVDRKDLKASIAHLTLNNHGVCGTGRGLQALASEQNKNGHVSGHGYDGVRIQPGFRTHFIGGD